MPLLQLHHLIDEPHWNDRGSLLKEKIKTEFDCANIEVEKFVMALRSFEEYKTFVKN